MKRFAAAVLAALIAVPAIGGAMEERFEKGETLDYTVSWLRITGGSARMTIGPASDGVFRITSYARSSPGFSRIVKVRDEIETLVDRDDFSTIRYVKRLDEKDDKIEEVTTVEDGIATRTRKKVKKVLVPRPVFDPISVIYYFRTLELTPGKVYDLTLISDGKVYNVHARIVRRETIQTPAGRFSTVVVEPQMASAGKPREEKLLVWYSDDERHLPVRIRTEVKFGAVTATLKGVKTTAEGPEPPM